MRYLAGLACLAYSAYFFYGIHEQKTRVAKARAELERKGPIVEKPIDPNSIAALGEMVAPMVQAALAFLALKMCFAYYIVDAGRFVSLFDLAGALTLLAAYGMWLSVKTKVRMPNVEKPEDVSAREAGSTSNVIELPSTPPVDRIIPTVAASIDPKLLARLSEPLSARLTA